MTFFSSTPSTRHLLEFPSRPEIHRQESRFPPLGLLTVAAMLPESWDKRLVDMNVQPLSDRDLAWRLRLYQRHGYPAGIGERHPRPLPKAWRQNRRRRPLFTSAPADFAAADHLCWGGGDHSPPIPADLEQGKARHIYSTDLRADLSSTPIPLWN